MNKMVEGFADCYEQLPGWARMLLCPILATVLLAYSAIALAFLLLSTLPYCLIFATKKRSQSPASNFSSVEVREHAESLNHWFENALAKHPDSADSLGIGPELARVLVELAGQPKLSKEMAEQFAGRVQREMKGYKGTPFSSLCALSHRLKDLSNNDRAA